MELDDQLQLKIITNIFHEIETIKGDSPDSRYIDAIITYCERNEIDVENFGKFVKSIPSLKSKLQEEAEELNYLSKTARLPV